MKGLGRGGRGGGGTDGRCGTGGGGTGSKGGRGRQRRHGWQEAAEAGWHGAGVELRVAHTEPVWDALLVPCSS